MKEKTSGFMKVLFTAVTASVALLFPRCASDISGGGSEAGNARISGMVLDKQGAPAGNVIVRIMPSDFDPVKDAPVADSFIDTTTADGVFRFNVTNGRMYTIQAVHKVSRLRALIASVEAGKTDDTVAVCALKPPGAVKVMLPSGIDAEFGYLYVPGTTVHAFPNNTSGYAMLDSIPAGVVPSISYSSTKTAASVIIRQNVDVLPESIVTISYPEWSYSKKLILNTSISGANVQGNVYGFPVLVRLTANTFDFTLAKAGGEDIRFASSGGEPLPYEIEQWDATVQRAEIWVKVDTMFGNDSTHFITMYWGNPTATIESNSAAVFDTLEGFQGVWHLSDAADDWVRDATLNHYHGASPDTAKPQVAEGVIGKCRVFDGANDYITMPYTAGSKLNYPENGYFTVSAWVNLYSLDSSPHLVVAKGYEQYFLRLTYFPSNSPLWEFSEFYQNNSWQACTTAATSRKWTLLTGVRQGSKQFLYCNGVLVDNTPNMYLSDSLSRNTSFDLSIGKFLKAVNVPNDNNDSYCFFKGSIDEVRISSAVQSPDWVRLCYMNQRPDDRLVVFK
jgi:hypothetical protein